MSILRASGAHFVSNSFALALQFVVVGFYNRRLGNEGLANYFVALSIANAVTPVLTGGLNDALSFLLGRKFSVPREAQGLTLLGVVFLCITTSVLVLVSILFPELASRVAFEQEGKFDLVLVTILFLFSRALLDFQRRYLMARKQILIPCLGMIIITGVIPLSVLWVDPTRSLERLLLDVSVLTLFVLAFPTWIEYRRHANAGSLCLSLNSMRYLLKLGIPRLPTILGMSLLISCQAFLARKMHCTADEMMIIGGAMMIVRTLAMTQRVVSSVVEPQIGWTSQDRPEILPVLLRTLTVVAAAVGIGAAATLFSAGDTILKIWMKRPDLPVGDLGRLFWFSTLPFTLLFVLRPCVNALSSRAYNTANMFYSLIGMAITLLVARFFSFSPSVSIGFATLLGGTLMALFSLTTVQKLQRIYTRETFLNMRTLLFCVSSTLLLGVGLWGTPNGEETLTLRSLVPVVLAGSGVAVYLIVIGYQASQSYRREIRRLHKSATDGKDCFDLEADI